MRRPSAVVVLADLPAPPRSGNHLRDLQTLRLVELLGYDVHVVAGVRTLEDERGIGGAGRLHATVPVADEQTTPYARARRLFRLARGGTGPGRAGPWALVYDDAGFPEVVEEAVDALRPEALVMRSTLAHLVPLLRPRVPRLVLDVHDSEVFLARSLLSLSLWRPLALPGAAARFFAAHRLERLMANADELWVPSRGEAAQLARRGRAVLVPNGVPVPAEPRRRKPRAAEILLLAGFGYPPNRAAAVRLVEEVLPGVIVRVPEAFVTLAGRDLPPALIRRWRHRPVRYLGPVERVAPLLDRAAVLALPYLPSTNAGTPLKVAEAVATGLPVVATRNATEPLGLVAGEHVLNGETGKELAAAICAVLLDPDSAEDLAQRAHAWARAHLDPHAIAKRLRRDSCLVGAVARPAA